MNVTRRHLLRATATAGAAALAGHWIGSPLLNTAQAVAQTTPAGTNAMLPIVDTHQHLWDLTKFRLPWLEQGSPLNRSFVTSDYQTAVQGLNVVKTVYMEVDVEARQQTEEADAILAMCRDPQNILQGGVLSGRPAEQSFRAYIERYRNNPHFKGVRQVLHVPGTPAGYCLQENFVAGIRFLGEHGLRFDLCMRPTELNDALRLTQLCPDTKFVLDHCGNADPLAFAPRRSSAPAPWHEVEPWRRAIHDLAQRPNVMCKISGIVARAAQGTWTAADLAPIVNHCLSEFGPDRVLFGGDWPVCTLRATFRQWVEALKDIVKDRSETEQRKLFHDNAVRFYQLPA